MVFRPALMAVVLALSLRPSTAQTIADRMQRVVQPYVDAQMFMGSILAAKDGKVIFSRELRDGGLGVERSKFPHYSIQHRFDDEAIHRSRHFAA